MRAFKLRSSVKTSLEIPDYFFSYSGEDENFYQFFVYFSILQSDIVKNSIKKVKIILQNRRKDLEIDTKEITNNNRHIENILSSHSAQINNARAKEASILQKVEVDVFSSVDSKIASLLRSGVNPTDIPDLYSEDYTTEVLPNSHIETFSNIGKDEVKKIYLEMIQNFQKDPATIYQDNFFDSFLYKNSLLNYYLNSAPALLKKDSYYYGLTKKKKFLDRKYFKTKVTIRKKSISNLGMIEAAFEVYQDQKKVPVWSVTKKVDISSHLKMRNFVFLPPDFELQNERMLVKQNDKNSDGYIIYKKEIDTKGNTSNYNVYRKNRLLKNQNDSIAVTKKSDTVEIFRCIPQNFSLSISGGRFSSTVLKDRFFSMDTTALLLGYSSDPAAYPGKMKITLKNQPYYATQFKIVRREKVDQAAFMQDVIVTNYRDFEGSSTLIVDETAQSGKTYEYSVYYKTTDGTIKRSVTGIHQFITSAITSAITTYVEQFSEGISFGEHQVNFSLRTNVAEGQLQKIKSLFIAANIYEEFRSEYISQKNDYSDIFFHQVFRLNKKTGAREHFLNENISSYNNTFYDDKKTRDKLLISPIDPTADYCYEIYVVIRDPNTLLKSSVISENKKIGNFIKNFSYNPYKWRQPHVLKTGTLYSQDNQGEILIENPLLEDGNVGMTASIAVNSKISQMGIREINSQRISLDKVKVTWSLKDSVLKDYDHFVVVKETGTRRKIIGTYFSDNFIDIINMFDSGSLIYYVIPVYSDYTVGEAVRTETMIINPEDFIVE